MKKALLCTFVLIFIFSGFGCSGNDYSENISADSSPVSDSFSVSLEQITEESPPEPEPLYTASFAGVGDNIIYYGNVRDAKRLAADGEREYNFRPAYSDVESMISSADIAFINQETVMCGDGYELSYYPMFNSPRDLAYDLCDVGFDVINIANNHMLDKGGAGIAATIDFWKTMPVTLIGGYSDSAEFYSVPVVETSGIRIAYISYCEMTNLGLGSGYSTRIPYLNEDDIKIQTDSVRDKCDLIIASVHWGEEGSFVPNDIQKYWAKVLADNGVDVILGHHPHVIQPVEWIKGENGNSTLCVYSLGNFMAEQDRDYNMLGGIITFDITKEGESRAVVDNVIFEPTVFYFPADFYNNHIYFLKDFTDGLASSHGVNTYYKHSLTLQKLYSYLTETISGEFLPDYIR